MWYVAVAAAVCPMCHVLNMDIQRTKRKQGLVHKTIIPLCYLMRMSIFYEVIFGEVVFDNIESTQKGLSIELEKENVKLIVFTRWNIAIKKNKSKYCNRIRKSSQQRHI